MSRSLEGLSVVIAGGGTGGHLFPGVAVARELLRQRPDARISFAGTTRGLEARIVPREGFEIDFIRSAGLKATSARARARGALLILPSLRDAWRIVTRRPRRSSPPAAGWQRGPSTPSAFWSTIWRDGTSRSADSW